MVDTNFAAISFLPPTTRTGSSAPVPGLSPEMQSFLNELQAGTVTPDRLAEFQGQVHFSDAQMKAFVDRMQGTPAASAVVSPAAASLGTDQMQDPIQEMVRGFTPDQQAKYQGLLAQAKKQSGTPTGLSPEVSQGLAALGVNIPAGIPGAASGLPDIETRDMVAGAATGATVTATTARMVGKYYKPELTTIPTLKEIPKKLNLDKVDTSKLSEATGQFTEDGKGLVSTAVDAGKKNLGKVTEFVGERQVRNSEYVAKNLPQWGRSAGEALSPAYQGLLNIWTGFKGTGKVVVSEGTAAVQLGTPSAVKLAAQTHIPVVGMVNPGGVTANAGNVADVTKMAVGSIVENPEAQAGVKLMGEGFKQTGTALKDSGKGVLTYATTNASGWWQNGTTFFHNMFTSAPSAVTAAPGVQQTVAATTNAVSSGGTVLKEGADLASKTLEGAGGTEKILNITGKVGTAAVGDGCKIAAVQGSKFLGHIAPGLAVIGVATSGYAFMKACSDPQASTLKKGLLGLSVCLNVVCAVAAEIPGPGTAVAAVAGGLDAGVSIGADLLPAAETALPMAA